MDADTENKKLHSLGANNNCPDAICLSGGLEDNLDALHCDGTSNIRRAEAVSAVNIARISATFKLFNHECLFVE